MAKVYDLSFESSLYSDDDDGYYRGNKGKTPISIVELSERPDIKLPDVLEFETHNPTRLKKVNIATANTSINILSQNLIDTIRSTGEVDWTLVPARFFNKTTGEEVCKAKFLSLIHI